MADRDRNPSGATATQDESRQQPPPDQSDDRKPALFDRKPWLKMVLILVSIVVLVGVALLWIHSSHWEDTDDAQVDGHIYSISTRISGHVSKVYFDDNQPVQAGAILAEIDPSDYQVSVARAQADYQDSLAQAQAAQSGVPLARSGAQTSIASANADVSNAEASVSAARKQADAARAQVEQAQANAVKANHDVDRYSQLVKKQEISQQQYDTAVAAAQSANAAVNVAQANVLSADQQVNVAQGRLLQARANLSNAQVSPANVRVTTSKATAADAAAKRAQASLQQAQLNLDYTKVFAPVSGIVGHRGVEVGQNVTPGQMLMSVVPLDDLWVTANFKETQLHKMRVGQHAKIHVDSIDKDIEGTVDSIGAATGAVFSILPPENATGNYVKVVQRMPVKITFKRDQDPDQRLRPGMSVEANVNVQ